MKGGGEGEDWQGYSSVYCVEAAVWLFYTLVSKEWGQGPGGQHLPAVGSSREHTSRTGWGTDPVGTDGGRRATG